MHNNRRGIPISERKKVIIAFPFTFPSSLWCIQIHVNKCVRGGITFRKENKGAGKRQLGCKDDAKLTVLLVLAVIFFYIVADKCTTLFGGNV